MKIWLRRTLSCVFIVALLFVSLAFITNVPTKITGEDSVVFELAFHLKKSQAVGLSYEEELQLIRSVQQKVLEVAPVGDPIPEYTPREPLDLLRMQSGLCYDRARTLDKVYNFLGFKTRHVFILYPIDPITKETIPFWQAFLTRGTTTHAATEVKTQRGWLVVDSNSNWVSVTSGGLPVESNQIQDSLNKFESIPEYLRVPFKAYKGLYSRRGQFYRPYIPFPQLNWSDYFNSFID